MDALKVTFYSSSLVFYLYVIYYDLLIVEKIERVENVTLPWSRYLTIWSFLLQTMYFAASLFCELLGLIQGQERTQQKIRSWSDYIVTAVSTPVALYVTASYWAVYSIDRNLISPESRREIIPLWLDHSLHTFNSIFALVDMVITKKSYSSHKRSVMGLILFCFIYKCIFVLSYFQNGRWVYPFFQYFSAPLKVLWFMKSYSVVTLTYFLAFVLHQIVWRRKVTNDSQKEKGISLSFVRMFYCTLLNKF